jgi:hypothetical protein
MSADAWLAREANKQAKSSHSSRRRAPQDAVTILLNVAGENNWRGKFDNSSHGARMTILRDPIRFSRRNFRTGKEQDDGNERNGKNI